MTTKKTRTHDLKELTSFTLEVDLIEAEVKALKEGLISKEVFDHLMSLHFDEFSEQQRYPMLLKHVHDSLQERFRQYEHNMISDNPDSDPTVLVAQAVDEGLISKDVLDRIVSLHPQVPVAMKTRYFLILLKEALEEKLEYLMSYLLKETSISLDSNNKIRVGLDTYIKEGLIPEDFLAYILSKTQDQYHNYLEFTEHLKHLKEKQLHHKLAAVNHTIVSSCVNLSQSQFIPTIGPQCLSKLNELLVGYSYKWKSIGVALNYNPQDLHTIEASPLLLADAPRSYLTRLLQDWLQMTLEHVLPPTVENLKKALNSQIVGLGKVSSELQASFCKTTPSLSLNLPCSSTNVSFDKKGLSFFPLHNEIYIGEGESTLLEIKVTCKEDLVFRWQNNGLSSGSLPILCLHKADIAWDGDFSCEVKASSTKSSSVVTVPITVHVSCPLDVFMPSLASMYLSRPEVPEDTWPPTGSTKYINLAIIKQQKVNYGSEYARLTIRGDIDDILQDKKAVDYLKLYDSLKRERQVMFIEGRPGCGKTTFVHKITRDWASNSSGGIRILLLVSLRVLNTVYNPSLSDILHLFRDLKATPEIIEKRDGKGVCFIFDGLDEFSPSDGKDSIVYKIIDRSYLHQSTVVVASRPAALAKLRNKADRIVEVIGFINTQIREYFDQYPFSDATKPVKLKDYLSLHPNILHMCYLPIHATMVAFLFEVTGQVPKTETKMYTLFMHFTLMRSISKSKEIESTSGDNILKCLNEEERCYFNQICRLALDKTLLNKQVLHQDEISFFFKVTKKGDISLGLITIDRTADLYGFKDIYTFLHLTFQEYLAAYHISTLSDEEQMKLIEEHGHKNHMLVVWKFFCGLVEIKALQNKFKTLLHKTQENTLYQFQCAYESQQQIVCAQLLKAVHYDIQIAEKFLSTPDFTAIGYVTNKTILPVKLSLANCDINTVAIDALLSEMEDSSRQSLESLHMEAKGFNCELLIKLLANFQSLKCLSLVKQKVENQEIFSQQASTEDQDQDLLEGKYSPPAKKQKLNQQASTQDVERLEVKKIETLTLKGFKDSSRVFQMMMSLCLRQCKNLTLIQNTISPLGAKHLTQTLPYCGSLRKIDISNNGMSSHEVIGLLRGMRELKLYITAEKIITQGEYVPISRYLLLEHLKPFTNLQGLDITLDNSNVDLFEQCSTQWQDLKELRIVAEQRAMSFRIAASVSTLQVFHKIEVFVLENVEYNIGIVEGLKTGLMECQKLKVAKLCNSDIALEHFKLLLSGDFSKLRELHFSNNHFTNKHVKLLASHLHNFPSLQVLNLSHNPFTNSGAKALAAQLHHCTNLVEVDLEGVKIRNSAACAIAAAVEAACQ